MWVIVLRCPRHFFVTKKRVTRENYICSVSWNSDIEMFADKYQSAVMAMLVSRSHTALPDYAIQMLIKSSLA